MQNNTPYIHVYGAGLAGCEAAWQAANRGVEVYLYEMKPTRYTPAHHYAGFAELVCSNSLRSDRITNAVGLLKEELTRMGSLIMEAARATQVAAGSALAVDRENFSDYVTEKIQQIAQVQEEIADFEAYKAEMEGQKTSSENTVLDSYDKEQYAADKELAAMSYQTAQEQYDTAKQGIVAAFDGIVMDCSAVQGATVTEGMQLLTIADSQNVKVTFNATKHDVEKLEVGQQATITISGNTYEGTVSKINRMATVNASNTPMVGVEVHINNPDDKIILGLDAKLEISTGEAENALLIPVESINADKEGDFLYVVENGIVVRKPIVCGISSDTHTEVLEGITEEDQIIVSSLTGFEEGMAVTVMPEQ